MENNVNAFYLNPLGGLGNRISAISSAIEIAEKNNKKLIIIWIKNKELNCPFNQLFETPSAFKITEIDANGSLHNKLKVLIYRTINNRDWNKTSFLNHLAKLWIAKNYSLFLSNRELAQKYASSSYYNSISLNENDEKFYRLLKPSLAAISDKNTLPVFISSCYRITDNKRSYKEFRPVKELQDVIDTITSSFNNTIGLHIRRGDHDISSRFSTTDKFIEIISKEIRQDPGISFFLSTDSEETENQIKNKFGSRIKTYKKRSYERNEMIAIEDAVIDLYSLSKTRKIYGSHYSTFTQVAIDIGKIEGHIVK